MKQKRVEPESRAMACLLLLGAKPTSQKQQLLAGAFRGAELQGRLTVLSELAEEFDSCLSTRWTSGEVADFIRQWEHESTRKETKR